MPNCLRAILPMLVALAPAAPALAEDAIPSAPAQASAQASAPAPGLTPQRLVTMDQLTAMSVSPDGRWMAYVVRTVSPDLKTISSRIMLADQDNPAAPNRSLEGVPAGQAMPDWSDDSATLYFSAPDKAGIRQIWRVAAAGGAPEQLTRSPVSIGSFRVAPNGRFAVAAVLVFPDCPTLRCSADRAAKPAPVAQLYTDLNVRFYDSYYDGRFNALFRLDFDGSHGAVALTPGYIGDIPSRPAASTSYYVISPDSGTLVFAARPSGVSAVESTIHRLFQVPLANPEPPREIGAGLGNSHLNPIFSPDGRMLAYLDKDGVGSDGDRAAVMVRDLATDTVHELGATSPIWPNEIAWSADGKTIFAHSDDDGSERLYAYRLSGKVERLGMGGVSALAPSARGLAVMSSSFAAPPQVFAVGKDGRTPRRLTAVGLDQIAGIPLAPTRSFTFKGWNGDTVQGYVTEPLNREPGKRYPVLFSIHGGPHGVYQDEWSFGRNPQLLAARGYATVMLNFHGSTGFGPAFTQAVLQHRGDRVLEDLQKGWAAAQVQFPFLDGNRACATGSSFGGYMIYWIAGVWNEPWRCLIAHAGTFDSRSYSSDLQWHGDRQNGGAPWDTTEQIEKFNPINHVRDWKKPILVTHGGRDYRVPIDQGLSAFILAQRRGIPSEMLYLPGEGHVVHSPAAIIAWFNAASSWLDRWTAP